MTRQLRISLAASGRIALHLPSPIAGRSHTVEIPESVEGLALLRKTLQAAASTPDPRIGMDASPTQHDIQEWLRAFKPQVKEKKTLTSAELEIDLSKINLEGLEL